MEVDEILVNLKVLEQLQVNQKLISRGPFLNIEYESIVPECIRRWRRQDNRNETIKKINLVINSALELKKKRDIDIDENLRNVCNGLRSLKETYSTCCQTTARIEVIISKIKLNTTGEISDEDNNKIDTESDYFYKDINILQQEENDGDDQTQD